MSGGIPEHQDHRPVEEASVDATVPAESDASTTTANEAPDNVDSTKDDNSVRDHESSSEVAKGLSTMLSSVIRDFDSRAEDTIRSQDQLCFALNRLNRELDQLLEDAPLPFIMQHAVRISGVRKRVSSLNTVLKSIQWRLDNIDCTLSMGLAHERAAGERQDNIITSQN